jgi:hypothetical protein
MTKSVLFSDPESNDWDTPKYLDFKYLDLLRATGVRIGGYEDLDDYWDDQITLSYVYEDDCKG